MGHHDTMRMRPPSNAVLQAGLTIRCVGGELGSRPSGGVNSAKRKGGEVQPVVLTGKRKPTPEEDGRDSKNREAFYADFLFRIVSIPMAPMPKRA
jgi:hypothetical protein